MTLIELGFSPVTLFGLMAFVLNLGIVIGVLLAAFLGANKNGKEREKDVVGAAVPGPEQGSEKAEIQRTEKTAQKKG